MICRAPQRLAPYAHAIAATVHDTVTDDEIGSGRFVILYDPEGVDSWGGTLRFVIFATCDVEGEIARDPASAGRGVELADRGAGRRWRRRTPLWAAL